MRIIRTAFLLGVLTLFLMMVGQYFGGRNGMTLGLGIAVCTNAFAYFFSDKIALLSSGARPVSREEVPRLYTVMERLAAKANIPVPKLYVIPEQLMNDDELEGVIAHELSHVRNYDILISSIAATLAGAITWIAHWGPWLGGGDRDDRDRAGGSGILGLLLFFLAPLAALLLQLGLSRQREFSADETGARMVGQPYGLMSALQKLGAYNQRIPTTSLSPSTSALCIVKPFFGRGTLSSLFSTHPPLEKRIETLREMTVTPQR